MQLQRTAVFLACKLISFKIVSDVMMHFYHLQILAVHECVFICVSVCVCGGGVKCKVIHKTCLVKHYRITWPFNLNNLQYVSHRLIKLERFKIPNPGWGTLVISSVLSAVGHWSLVLMIPPLRELFGSAIRPVLSELLMTQKIWNKSLTAKPWYNCRYWSYIFHDAHQ